MLPPQDDVRGQPHRQRGWAAFRPLPQSPTAAEIVADRGLSLAFRSAAAFVFATAFLWPTINDAMLFRLFAAYAFVDGVLALAPGGWELSYRRAWPLLIGGCVNLVGSGIAYAWPGMNVPMLADVTAIWAVAIGGTFAIACFTLREADPDCLLLLGGIASLVFGRALMSQLAGDVIVLSTWMGLYALTMGVLLLKLTLRRYLAMLDF